MKALHRIVGNFPNTAHFMPAINSTGFPTAFPMETFTKIHLPTIGLCKKAYHQIRGSGLIVFWNLYELHALCFSQYAVLHSTTFAPGIGERTFNYTDMVVPADAQNNPVCLSAEYMLEYNQFLLPEEADKIQLSDTTYDPTEFAISAYAEGDPGWKIPDKMLRSLLFSFWKNCTCRLFREAPSFPVTLCLGKDEKPDLIIEQAKNFLMHVLLKNLPAIKNIVSMAAPVPRSSIVGQFDDSALIVVYPKVLSLDNQEQDVKADYDLRYTDLFKEISVDEDRFMQDYLSDKNLSLLHRVFSRCHQLPGETKEFPTVETDYEIAFLLHALERGLILNDHFVKAENVLKIWKRLTVLLTGYHHLSNGQASFVLKDAEEIILNFLTSSSQQIAAAVSEAKGLSDLYSFLWKKSLYVDEAHFDAVSRLIAACDDAYSFADCLLFVNEKDVRYPERAGKNIQAIFAASKKPLEIRHIGLMKNGKLSDAQEQLPLMDEKVLAIFRNFPVIHDKMADGLQRNNQDNPENLLVALPLTNELCDKKIILENAIQLLQKKYIDVLPPAAIFEQFAVIYNQNTDDHLRTLLADYISDCFCFHKDRAEKLPIISGMANLACACKTVDAVLFGILQKARDKHILFSDYSLKILYRKIFVSCTTDADTKENLLDYTLMLFQKKYVEILPDSDLFNAFSHVYYSSKNVNVAALFIRYMASCLIVHKDHPENVIKMICIAQAGKDVNPLFDDLFNTAMEKNVLFSEDFLRKLFDLNLKGFTPSPETKAAFSNYEKKFKISEIHSYLNRLIQLLPVYRQLALPLENEVTESMMLWFEAEKEDFLKNPQIIDSFKDLLEYGKADFTAIALKLLCFISDNNILLSASRFNSAANALLPYFSPDESVLNLLLQYLEESFRQIEDAGQNGLLWLRDFEKSAENLFLPDPSQKNTLKKNIARLIVDFACSYYSEQLLVPEQEIFDSIREAMNDDFFKEQQVKIVRMYDNLFKNNIQKPTLDSQFSQIQKKAVPFFSTNPHVKKFCIEGLQKEFKKEPNAVTCSHFIEKNRNKLAEYTISETEFLSETFLTEAGQTLEKYFKNQLHTMKEYVNDYSSAKTNDAFSRLYYSALKNSFVQRFQEFLQNECFNVENASDILNHIQKMDAVSELGTAPEYQSLELSQKIMSALQRINGKELFSSVKNILSSNPQISLSALHLTSASYMNLPALNSQKDMQAVLAAHIILSYDPAQNSYDWKKVIYALSFIDSDEKMEDMTKDIFSETSLMVLSVICAVFNFIHESLPEQHSCIINFLQVESPFNQFTLRLKKKEKKLTQKYLFGLRKEDQWYALN